MSVTGNGPDWAEVKKQVNWELLDLCIEHAILYPEQFDMREWVQARDPEQENLPAKHVNGPVGTMDNTAIVKPGCGTTACLAGTALLLKGHAPMAVKTGRGWVLDETRMVTPDGDAYVDVEAHALDVLGVRGLDYWVCRAAPFYLPGLFYGPDIHSVIEWRNVLAGLCDVKQRSFNRVFEARKLLDKVDNAWNTAADLRAAARKAAKDRAKDSK